MKNCNYHLYLLRQIRQYLTVNAAKVVALGLVISRIDYANSLQIGMPNTKIQKLQALQNMTAKVILKKPISSSLLIH